MRRLLLAALLVGCSSQQSARTEVADDSIDWSKYPTEDTLIVNGDTIIMATDGPRDTIYWRIGCENDLSSARCTAPLPVE